MGTNVKFYLNRKSVRGPWGGGAHFFNAFYDVVPNLNHEISRDNPDVILLAGLHGDDGEMSVAQALSHKVNVNSNCKIVLRVNDCDARKNTTDVDWKFLSCSSVIDGAVFVSNWMRDYYYKKGWACRNNAVIYNGVDAEAFKPGKKLFSNGKIAITTAHWSDNPMKGQDYIEWIDDFVGKHYKDFSFYFIGRTRARLKNSWQIHPLCGKDLGNEIAKYDVCINATRFDPGPNSVIEPISCGLPTYVHVDGGGAVEFAGADHIFASAEELERLLLSKKFEKNKASFESWDKVIDKYVQFMANV